MLMTDHLIETLVQAASRSGLSKTAIARRGSLHLNTLRNFGGEGWNPSLSTLRRLEQALVPPEAPPQRRRRQPRRPPS